MTSAALKKISGFLSNRSGGVGAMLALALPVLMGIGGGAVDFATAKRSQVSLQSLADSAALAVVKELTLNVLTPAGVRASAISFVTANAGHLGAVTTEAGLREDNLAVFVKLSAPLSTPFGIIQQFSGAQTIEAQALARISAASTQSKLCLLSLGEKLNGGIFMHNGSVINAPECILNSNSSERDAVIIQTGSKITANLICARGGIQNLAGIIQATTVGDCPRIRNPLETKAEPDILGPCLETNKQLKNGDHILKPGVYCNGLTIFGKARVTLQPGVYVFRNGPLSVKETSSLSGAGVTLMFSGRKAYFRFLDQSTIRISAPITGISAGMLIWESKTFIKGLNSWQNGGCGGNGDDDDDDRGNNGCKGNNTASAKPVKKTNEHHINSDNARELTGTIYLPNGLLLIDSVTPIADQSPFTVFVVQKLDLFDGPRLTLNANYKGTQIPVPTGLGPIGGSQVRLGK